MAPVPKCGQRTVRPISVLIRFGQRTRLPATRGKKPRSTKRRALVLLPIAYGLAAVDTARGTYRSSRIDRSSRIVAVSPCPPNISASQIAAIVGAIWRVPSSVTR